MVTQEPKAGARLGNTEGPAPEGIPLAQILDSLPQAIFWKGLDGAYLGCNQAFADVAGLAAPDQVRGLTDAELPWPPEEREAYRADDQEVIARNRPKRHIIEPIRGPGGDQAWIATTKLPLLDAQQRVCGVLGYFEDVTEHRRITEALKESELRLRFALDGANDGLWDVQMRSNDVYLSPRACEILGYAPDELPLVATRWPELVHPEDLPLTQERLQAHLDGRAAVFEVEQRLRMKNGDWKWVLARGKVVERDEQGRPLRMTGTHTDLTERRQADQERQQLTAQLHQSQKLESLGSLAGGVAHDINNVLAAILGLATAHRDELAEGSVMARSMDTITSACLRGRDVVKSLLYFARKDLEIRGPVALNGIVREMVQLLESTTLKRIQLHMDLQEPLPVIEGDAGSLSHSLMNLCVNAVDAMPQGGVIRIRTRALADGTVEMSVQDTGQGMTPEVAKQAMEPFFTTKAVGKGTGLGLAMVYGTVKAHGGRLELHSVPGAGTEARLSFPALPAQPGAGAPGPAPGVGPSSLRILLVDDDELIRLSMVPVLTGCGHQLTVAEGGRQALDLFEAGLEVDLVILDMNMPGLSGAETLPRIHALRPRQPVLLCTGHSDVELSSLLQERPRVAFLRKPFTLGELKAKFAEMGLGEAVPAADRGARPEPPGGRFLTPS